MFYPVLIGLVNSSASVISRRFRLNFVYYGLSRVHIALRYLISAELNWTTDAADGIQFSSVQFSLDEMR